MKRNLVPILLAAGLLAGCTASFGGASGLTVAIQEGAGDPQVLLDAYGDPKATVIEVPAQDFRLYANNAPGGVTVLGLDNTFDLPGLTQYGDDYACVAVNRSWFAVNKIGAPTGREALTDKAYARFVSLPAPDTSVDAAWFLATKDTESFLSGIEKNGGILGGTNGAVTVASALLPWRDANNTKTDSQWETLTDTCVTRPVFAAGGGQDFLEFLTTAGPLLAQAGVAYPLRGTVPEDVAKLAPRPTDAVDGNVDKQKYQQVQAAWDKVTGTVSEPQSE